MKIILDAFGGDNAPLEIIKGAVMAKEELDIDILLVGDTAQVKSVAEDNGLDISNIELEDANGAISVEDDPMLILRDKKDCSLGKCLTLLADGHGDALVSASSTAALVVGASLLVKRIKGIRKAALCPIVPTDKGYYLLIDSGANLDCTPQMLAQFGMMGSAYMECVMGIKNPVVGLANIGAEENKGHQLQIDAFSLLKNSPINFYGNIEARDIPFGTCDVVVADGFTGNIILKLTEGVALNMAKQVKKMFTKNLGTKLSALALTSAIKDFKKKMDYTEVGGAPLLGIKKPVIKAHGSSNAKAIKNALKQAKLFVDNKVNDKIENFISGDVK